MKITTIELLSSYEGLIVYQNDEIYDVLFWKSIAMKVITINVSSLVMRKSNEVRY